MMGSRSCQRCYTHLVVCRPTICNHHADLSLDGFIRHSLREIDCQEDRVPLLSGGIAGRLQQHFHRVRKAVIRSLSEIQCYRCLHPVLSKLLSASSSGYLVGSYQWPRPPTGNPRRTNILRMALTTLLVKGDSILAICELTLASPDTERRSIYRHRCILVGLMNDAKFLLAARLFTANALRVAR